MQQYFYKITHVPSGRVYVGCQYEQTADPSNMLTTYFTPSPRVHQSMEVDGVGSLVVNYTVPAVDAQAYERRYMRRAFKWLERDKFLQMFINRNLAPGILLEGWAMDNLKSSLREAWNSPKKREHARQGMLERHANGTINISGCVRSAEFRQRLSHILTVSNPKKRKDVK